MSDATADVLVQVWRRLQVSIENCPPQRQLARQSGREVEWQPPSRPFLSLLFGTPRRLKDARS